MLRRHVIPNVIAFAAGLSLGHIVDSALAAGMATLVFALLFAMLGDRPGRQR